MLHFIRDTFKHESLRMSKALYAGIICLPEHMYYATEEKEEEKKNKTDRCPDVGQKRHVFAFMFWNLHCKVATLVQGISHITLPNLLLLSLYSATFCLSFPPSLRSKTPFPTLLCLSFLYPLSLLTLLKPILPLLTLSLSNCTLLLPTAPCHSDYQNLPFCSLPSILFSLCRTTPLTQPLARASMLSIITARPTLRPT